MVEKGVNGAQQKLPKSKGFAVNQVIYNWFCEAINRAIPICVNCMHAFLFARRQTWQLQPPLYNG